MIRLAVTILCAICLLILCAVFTTTFVLGGLDG